MENENNTKLDVIRITVAELVSELQKMDPKAFVQVWATTNRKDAAWAMDLAVQKGTLEDGTECVMVRGTSWSDDPDCSGYDEGESDDD